LRFGNEYHAPGSTNTPKAVPNRAMLPYLSTHIWFSNRTISYFIDRLSVLQHETALLISGSIPVLMGW
jgi:hypothetical protein